MRLLLVEDNEINIEVAQGLLRPTQIQVEVARTGRQAVEMVLNGGQPYDMVLMDIQLPELDGCEATRLIRADPRFRKLPILAMTAHTSGDETAKALRAGMNGYITKPLDAATLVSTMEEYGGSPGATRRTPSASTVAAAGGEFPFVPGLDPPAALRRLGGDAKLYREVLRRFVSGQSDAGARIQEAVQRLDWELAARLTHTVRGLAGSIAAGELQRVASQLEDAIHARDERAMAQTLSPFLLELDGLIGILQQTLRA